MVTIDLSKVQGVVDVGGVMPAPQGLSEFYLSFVQDVEGLQGRRIDLRRNVSAIIETCEKFGVVGVLNEGADPAQVSPEDYAEVVRNLGLHLGFRFGTVVALNLLGTHYGVHSASLNPELVERLEYLERPLIISQVRVREPQGAENRGFSLCNLALYDPLRAAQDSRNGLEFLPQAARDFGAHTFAGRLLSNIQEQRVSPLAYAHICGIPRARMEALQQAKDTILCEALLGREPSLSEKAQQLLREDSSIRALLSIAPSSFDDKLLAHAVTLYAAALGGVLLEIESHLKEGKPEYALLAFDDFMWEKELRIGAEDDNPYRIEAALFFRQLGGIVGSDNIYGAPFSKLISDPSLDKRARNAQLLLRSLYRSDLYEDCEREVRVK